MQFVHEWHCVAVENGIIVAWANTWLNDESTNWNTIDRMPLSLWTRTDNKRNMHVCIVPVFSIYALRVAHPSEFVQNSNLHWMLISEHKHNLNKYIYLFSAPAKLIYWLRLASASFSNKRTLKQNKREKKELKNLHIRDEEANTVHGRAHIRQMHKVKRHFTIRTLCMVGTRHSPHTQKHNWDKTPQPSPHHPTQSERHSANIWIENSQYKWPC